VRGACQQLCLTRACKRCMWMLPQSPLPVSPGLCRRMRASGQVCNTLIDVLCCPARRLRAFQGLHAKWCVWGGRGMEPALPLRLRCAPAVCLRSTTRSCAVRVAAVARTRRCGLCSCVCTHKLLAIMQTSPPHTPLHLDACSLALLLFAGLPLMRASRTRTRRLLAQHAVFEVSVYGDGLRP
jgi:hypothetical protein